jgi:glucosamine 6-phosphate synthetase-like amidotransferase/phosphosugar isomerase protein
LIAASAEDIHAEAYPAGELKHGPIALIDKETPVIAVAPNDELFTQRLFE